MSLAAFESIAVATAMPIIARDLDALSVYSWGFNAYICASLIGMVVSGLLCDRGRLRDVATVAIGLFAVGAVVAGIAPVMAVLIAGRAVQGFAGGAVVVAVYVIMARAFPAEIRPRAFVLLSAAWVVPSLIGPAVAGVVAEQWTWRAVFLVVPILVIGPAFVILPTLRSLSAVEGTPAPGARGRLLWALVAAAALAVTQDGLLRLGWTGVIETLAGLATLIAAARALLPRGALRLARGLPTTVVMRGIGAWAYFAAEAYIPLAMVDQRRLSASAAGLALSVAAIGWLVGSWSQGRLPATTDRPRLVRYAMLLVAVSIATLPLALLPAVPWWTVIISFAVGAIGMGLTFPTLAVLTFSLSAEAEQGVNSSALQICDSIACVLGIGIAGAVLSAAVAGGGPSTWTFTLIWSVCAAVALGGSLAAPRMRAAVTS